MKGLSNELAWAISASRWLTSNHCTLGDLSSNTIPQAASQYPSLPSPHYSLKTRMRDEKDSRWENIQSSKWKQALTNHQREREDGSVVGKKSHWIWFVMFINHVFRIMNPKWKPLFKVGFDCNYIGEVQVHRLNVQWNVYIGEENQIPNLVPSLPITHSTIKSGVIYEPGTNYWG